MSLPKEIRAILPDVIIDYIGEFNADHREQMNKVVNEIFVVSDYVWLPFTNEYYECSTCGKCVCDVNIGLTWDHKEGKWLREEESSLMYYGIVSENYDEERNWNCSVKKKIAGNYYTFCSSYCEWDLTYDIRKSYRRRRCITKYSEKVKNEFAEIKYMENKELEKMSIEDKK